MHTRQHFTEADMQEERFFEISIGFGTVSFPIGLQFEETWTYTKHHSYEPTFRRPAQPQQSMRSFCIQILLLGIPPFIWMLERHSAILLELLKRHKTPLASLQLHRFMLLIAI